MNWTTDIQKELTENIIPALSGEVFALNDWMARNPEIGSEEWEASRRIVSLLRLHGLEVEYPFLNLPTSFKASVNAGAEKRKAVLLAEYDALPDIGHGCGHCAGGSAAVLAILGLKQIAEQLGDMQIDIIGTPDEELSGGKVFLAEKHAFDEYEFAAMVHMNDINLSQVHFSAIDGMVLEFKGRPSHAAFAPEAGRNALNAARLFFDSVDMMRQHIDEKARVHGYIMNGGTAANTIPDYARVGFLTRAPYRAELDDITSWVKECACAAAMATRTEVEILPYGTNYDSFHTGPAKNRLIAECFREQGLPVDEHIKAEGGSSDIGNVNTVCPAFHPMIGIQPGLVAHTQEFAEVMTMPETHEAIRNGAKILIELCRKLYMEPERLDAIQKES